MNGPNMDQRHLNKPKTGHDVARCNLKKQRMLKDTWFLSSLELHCPLYLFAADLHLCEMEEFLPVF